MMPSPNSVPSSAVEVRAENPCAKYSTANIIAAEPVNATGSAGWPSIRAGSMNATSTA